MLDVKDARFALQSTYANLLKYVMHRLKQIGYALDHFGSCLERTFTPGKISAAMAKKLCSSFHKRVVQLNCACITTTVSLAVRNCCFGFFVCVCVFGAIEHTFVFHVNSWNDWMKTMCDYATVSVHGLSIVSTECNISKCSHTHTVTYKNPFEEVLGKLNAKSIELKVKDITI